MSSEACAACGAANPAGALFCGRCGAPLGRECPSCGAVVGLETAFCTACGTVLEAPPRAAAAEERKVVSVLFADLVGFTGRAERLDPEDVRGLLAPYHARLRTELERFSGTVEKFIGDAVVALFGAPVAHEDDPERAVRAALAVREAISELNAGDPSLALQVRVGVTTGEALVTRDARPSEGEGMAAGDVVNTAARLQAAAPVDGVLVDEATYRATEQAIEYREHEPVSAKGKTAPIEVWEVVAPRARLGVDIAFRGGATLVGRGEELDVLRDALSRAARERTAQLVTLVGVPGIGKSRLLYELWAALEADPDLYAYWRQGRSLPYGDGISFWALGEMTKAHAGILETDDAEVAAAKLRDAVEHAVPDPTEAGWIESHLRPLVGLGEEAGTSERRGEAFAAWRRFFESLGEQHPVVLVFEDVHWADDGLLDFVDYLVEWVSDMPLLVVCTARPELLERRPDWGGGKRNAITISLAPLSDEDTAQLLSELVATAPGHLVSRAGGNPLYAEEYARMLAQRSDGEDLPLPDSVQGIIAARLDTLPLDEKALLQDAAVLGKIFWVGAAAAVAGLEGAAAHERLHALERKEFVRRERRSSVEGETAYVFRHELVREVAYGQIPRSRRATKHQAAAEWIELLAGDRTDDLADVVAHHLVSALELARAAGDEPGALADQTRLALRRAGDRAARLNAFAEAARFYGEALELWPQEDAERPRLLFSYGRSLFYSADTGADVLTEAAEELLDLGDREAAAEAQTIVGELCWIEGRGDEASKQFRGAVALLADAPPSRAKAHVLGILSRFLMTADRAEEAIRIGSEAFRMADELDLDELRAQLLNSLGVARASIGDLSGLADIERSVEISTRINSPEAMRAYNNLASTVFALGDLERAYGLYRMARRSAERFGRWRAVRWIETEEMYEFYWRGRWQEALGLATEFIAESEFGTPHIRDVDARLMTSRILLARGETDAALEIAASAVGLAERVSDPQTLFPALALNARAAAAAGTAAADEVAHRLLELWRGSPSTFASFWTADAAAALSILGRGAELAEVESRILLRTKWLEAASAFVNVEFLDSARIYAEIGSLPDEAFARLRAAQALAAADRAGEAGEEIAAALDFWRKVGASAYAAEAEALLAVRPA
jgi:class 3 adenylate cyclase/tetratricopeptide (TPR) repeat protein